MHAGGLASGRSPTLFALAILLLVGCGDGSGQRRPAGSPTAVARTPAPSATPAARAATSWPQPKVLRRIAGRRIRVGRAVVQVDPATATCGGVGAPAGRVAGKTAWTRFRCVQPTFPSGVVAGPDAIFIVEPRGRRAFAVTAARFTHY